jgi:hypothetical protein
MQSINEELSTVEHVDERLSSTSISTVLRVILLSVAADV